MRDNWDNGEKNREEMSQYSQLLGLRNLLCLGRSIGETWRERSCLCLMHFQGHEWTTAQKCKSSAQSPCFAKIMVSNDFQFWQKPYTWGLSSLLDCELYMLFILIWKSLRSQEPWAGKNWECWSCAKARLPSSLWKCLRCHQFGQFWETNKHNLRDQAFGVILANPLSDARFSSPSKLFCIRETQSNWNAWDKWWWTEGGHWLGPGSLRVQLAFLSCLSAPQSRVKESRLGGGTLENTSKNQALHVAEPTQGFRRGKKKTDSSAFSF